MKTRKLLLFSAALFLAVVSCKKDAEVNKDTFKIENEKVTPSTQSVMITGSYAYSGAIDGITLELGRQTDLMDDDAYRTLIEDTDFSVEVKNLRTNTTYYYRYAVEYGGKTPYYTDIKSFKTQEYNLPEVKSIEVVSVGVNRAEVSGEVLGDGGGDAVTLRGICWSMSHNPSVGDEYANAGEGIGTFTCELTNLQPEKTYYARAFAGNSKGVSYGEELTFVTLAAGSLAEVKTIGITGNANLQATVNGEVTSEGTSSVIERGVCYGKEHYPTTSGLHVSAGTGAGAFNCQLMNLEANVTYFVRAYAINSLGIAYGEEMGFVAQSETTAPVVLTGMVSDITVSSATGHCTVVSDGGATVTRRGLCWGTEHNPTVDGSHVDCGSGVGNFSGLMPHLTDLTTYYVRAYAENAVGMAYGEEVSFTVGQHAHAVPPTVVTGLVTDINPTTAVGHCEVTSDGGSEVTERGLCWGTSQNPTIEGSHAHNGTGTGSYTVMMTGLQPETAYYVRAYATNSVDTSYGEEMEFRTYEGLPTVATMGVTDITGTTATGHGEVTEEGASGVTERGICWSTSHNPTTDGDHSSNGTGVGAYDVPMTGLTPSATYYVRAYATNDQGTSYGEETSFTALEGLPMVDTKDVTDIGTTTATGHGDVTEEGASAVTERGICWSTSHNPTTSGSHASNGTGTGSYTVNMTGLERNTVYYMKAYAINGQGTVYGSEVEFSTEAEPPAVATSAVTNITQTTASCGGNVTDDGGSEVTERGICWSTSHNPTISDSHTASGTGMGAFTANMTGLTANTTYYVRAYARNSVGVAYGYEVSFTTAQLPEYTISVSANPSAGGTVSGGGTYQQGQSCTVKAVANSGYTFTNWTENGSVVSTNANYSFTVNAARTLVAHFTLQTSLPTVTTSAVTNIAQTTATCGGNVTADGNATVTERGICWSTSHNPTISDSHTASGTGMGAFTENMTGLTANTTYYVRAYARNSVGVAYGYEVSFTTAQLPEYTISVSANPSAGGTVSGGGTYQQGQSCTLTATANSGYYFTNWTENGSVVSTNANYSFTVNAARTLVAHFTLQTSLPTVTTSAVTNIAQTTATCGGNVTADGNATVTERGICWSTSHNPTISDSHTASGTGMGAFTANMTGLTANTTYYVRAYAMNSVGVAYGYEVSFTTGGNIVVEIGTGTSTTYQVPYYSFFVNSCVEQIYTANEIGTAGTINSISFNMSGDDSGSADVVVYMKNVVRNSFSGSDDYETVSESDIVFNGSWNYSPGWTTITLDTPFEYDGTSNLLLVFSKNSGEWRFVYYYCTQIDNSVMAFYSDNTVPDPYNLGEFGGNAIVSNNRSNIRINITINGAKARR